MDNSHFGKSLLIKQFWEESIYFYIIVIINMRINKYRILIHTFTFY